jgi:hypothetical protein
LFRRLSDLENQVDTSFIDEPNGGVAKYIITVETVPGLGVRFYARLKPRRE